MKAIFHIATRLFSDDSQQGQ